MKNWIALLAAGIALYSTPLPAEYDLEDVGSDEMPKHKHGQFTLDADADWVLRSKHRGNEYSGHIDYNHQEASFNAIVWYNECYREGISLGLGYEHIWLHWNENPFFKRKEYNNLSTSFTYFTHRLCDWRWIFQATFNVDADKWDVNEYSDYDLLLWGLYHYCEDFHLHFGLYAQTGMKLDRVWPILGFDWQYCENWKINAVFPLNLSVVYTLNDMWSFAVAGRVFNERQRAGNEGGFKKAVWRYENSGVEFDIENNWCNWLKTNIHAGYTFGGKLKVANRHAHDSHRFKFKSAPYFGGSIVADF